MYASRLSQECSKRQLAAGEVLYRQGDAAEAFYLVDSGAVQMSYTAADGRMLPSKVHKPQDVFGASGVYGRRASHHHQHLLSSTPPASPHHNQPLRLATRRLIAGASRVPTSHQARVLTASQHKQTSETEEKHIAQHRQQAFRHQALASVLLCPLSSPPDGRSLTVPPSPRSALPIAHLTPRSALKNFS